MSEFHALVAEWETFALLVGTAGATLAGLMFVAVTFSGRFATRRSVPILRAHTDPALLAFVLCLAVSLVLLVPGLTRFWCSAMLLVAGAAQALYMGGVLRQLVRGGQVRGWDLSDWFWYATAPLASAVMLLGAGGLCLSGRATSGLGLTGLSLLLLLLMGIRNAWDMVTYTLVVHPEVTDESGAGQDDTDPA